MYFISIRKYARACWRRNDIVVHLHLAFILLLLRNDVNIRDTNCYQVIYAFKETLVSVE